MDGDADDAKGEQEQPDDGVEHERGEGERPAEEQECEEDEELEHGGYFLLPPVREGGAGETSRIVFEALRIFTRLGGRKFPGES